MMLLQYIIISLIIIIMIILILINNMITEMPISQWSQWVGRANADTVGIVNKLSPESPVNHWLD